MKTNESGLDRIIRAILSVVLIAGALAVGIGSFAGILMLIVGAVMGVTAATGFCPLYRVLGLSTVSSKK